MGCWNETCAITNLPIRAGDPAVAVLLKKHDAAHIGIYPDDLYSPQGLPLFGEYNDYGNLEQIQTHPWNQEFLSNKTETETSLSELPAAQPCQPIMFLHREIYNKIIHAVGSRVPCGRNVQNRTYRECLQNQLQSRLSNRDAINSAFQIGQWTNHEASLFFQDKFQSCADETLRQSMLDDLTDSCLLYTALTLLRKGYFVQSGTGSQSLETALHVLVAKFTLEHVKNMGLDDDPADSRPDGEEETIFWFE